MRSGELAAGIPFSGILQVHTASQTFGHSQWFHVARTMDQTNADYAQWQIYVNEGQVLLSYAVYRFPTATSVIDCHFRRGSTHSSFFNGNLNNFRVYEHALNAAKVSSAFHQKALNLASDGTTCPGLGGKPAGDQTTLSGANLVECPVNLFQDGSSLKCTPCPVSSSICVGAPQYTLQHTAAHCSTLQLTGTYCNALQRTATHCNTLQETARHRSQHIATHAAKHAVHTLQYTLQHTMHHTIHHSAPQCTTVQGTATHSTALQHCNTPQHTVMYCDALQHTATHQCTLQRIHVEHCIASSKS